jgi:hypothetical protein
MTDKTPLQLDINLIEMVNLSANVLHKTFLSSTDKKARDFFKTLKQGKAIKPGTLSLGKELEAPLDIALDYSEFQGPGFNFDIFVAALHAMLKRISAKLKAKEDLNIMSSETGSFLVNLPGMVEREGHVNVLVMSLDFSVTKKITLQLMFLDPEQFKKEQPADETP